MSCSKDWRLLIPLWRTEPLYHELKHSHGHYEHTHNNWRSRYRVAADDLGIRPKRRGVGWQRLRATCGLIAEWLRTCHREGWLGSARTNRKHKVERPADWQKAGKDASDDLAVFRNQIGLAAPYGPAAHAADPKFSPDIPSLVYAAKRKAERERQQRELAAERAARRAGTRKRKRDEPPPPKAPRPAPSPPPATGDEDAPF